MKFYEYEGQVYTINGLSELSGIEPATLRDRLRRGYSLEQALKAHPTNDSVVEFSAASYYMDWIGMPISYLYEIYWKWCIDNGYNPLKIQGFSRQLMGLYPNLKTVPTKKKDRCFRIIRLK